MTHCFTQIIFECFKLALRKVPPTLSRSVKWSHAMMLTRVAASFSRSEVGAEHTWGHRTKHWHTTLKKKPHKDTRLNPVEPEAAYRRRAAARRRRWAASCRSSELGARRLLTRSRLGGGAGGWCARRERRTNGLRSGCGDSLLEFRQFHSNRETTWGRLFFSGGVGWK